MNKEIFNEEKTILENSNLNEKDYITLMLDIEKKMAKGFVVAMEEASNKELFNDYYDMFDAIINSQRELYEVMFRKGWYKLEVAEEQKIQKKLDFLTNQMAQLEKI